MARQGKVSINRKAPMATRAEPEVRTIGTRTIHTQMFIDRLKAALDAKEEVLTWAQLSECIADDARNYRSHLDTARKTILREYNAWFGSVPGVGLKNLTSLETIGEAASTRRSIHRKSKRAMELLYRAVDTKTLTREESTRYNTEFAMTAFLHHATTEKAVQKLSAKSQAQESKVSIAECLELLK